MSESFTIAPNRKMTFSVNEACMAAGVGRSFLYSEIRNQNLRARKLGRRTIILSEDLADWLRGKPEAAA